MDEVGTYQGEQAQALRLDEVSQMLTARKSAAGLKALTVTIAFAFLLIVAMLLDVVYLYVMAVALAMIQPVAYFVAIKFTPKYAVTRALPSTGMEGQSVRIRLDVNASGGLPQGVLHLVDTLPNHFVSEIPPANLGCMTFWDGSHGYLEYSVMPLLRGVYTFTDVVMDSSDPVGLYFFESAIRSVSTITVHPSSSLVPNSTNGHRGAVGKDQHDGNARRGSGVDLHGVRDYIQGESLRRVHWRSSARRDKLVVVEYDESLPQDMRVILFGTTSEHRGVAHSSTFEIAVKVVATLSDRVQRDGGAFNVACGTESFGTRVRAGNPKTRYELLEWLACINPSAVAVGVSNPHRRGEGSQRTVIVTPVINDRLVDAIRQLSRTGAEVEVILVTLGMVLNQFNTMLIPRAVRLRIIDETCTPWIRGGRYFVTAIGAN